MEKSLDDEIEFNELVVEHNSAVADAVMYGTYSPSALSNIPYTRFCTALGEEAEAFERAAKACRAVLDFLSGHSNFRNAEVFRDG